MWADAQRHGRPAEYRCRPLLNAVDQIAKLSQDAKPVKIAGVSQTRQPTQPLVGRSSPYCEDVWRRYCCLTIFFRLSICALVAKI